MASDNLVSDRHAKLASLCRTRSRETITATARVVVQDMAGYSGGADEHLVFVEHSDTGDVNSSYSATLGNFLELR